MNKTQTACGKAGSGDTRVRNDRLATYGREAGGPREGSGGAVAAAMCAAATGCRACANEEGTGRSRVLLGGGAAVTEAHKGQSIGLVSLTSPSDSLESSIFMPPSLAQTICRLLGWISVAAMADPTNSANHTSTRLAMCLALRRACMGADYDIGV